MRSNLLEAIAQLQGGSVLSEQNENGTVRLKIVLNKRQLSELMVLMRSHRSNAHKIAAAASSLPSASSTLEQRMRAMQRRQRSSRSENTKRSRRGPWQPALQSIPEEL